MSTTAKPQSKAQRAYSHLKERISDGSYTPGYRLVLGQIATELGVSVVPVREAIRRLEAEGLVTYELNVGAQVAMFHEAEYLFTMQTLSVVESAATALASPLISREDIARARSINEEMVACLNDFDPIRFSTLNHDFHAVLFGKCPNPHLLDLVHRGWDRLRHLLGSTFSFVPGRARESVAEHEALLRLIETGSDAWEIEHAARRHRDATLDAFLARQAASD
jgi:DNA-binding GntR family transcriptional regulator